MIFSFLFLFAYRITLYCKVYRGSKLFNIFVVDYITTLLFTNLLQIICFTQSWASIICNIVTSDNAITRQRIKASVTQQKHNKKRLLLKVKTAFRHYSIQYLAVRRQTKCFGQKTVSDCGDWPQLSRVTRLEDNFQNRYFAVCVQIILQCILYSKTLFILTIGKAGHPS